MATIRKRNDRWQVQVRRLGAGSVSKTFNLKADAVVWARDMEAQLERGGNIANQKLCKQTTLSDLINRYVEEILPSKKSAEQEGYTLKLLLREGFSRLPLYKLTRNDFSKYFKRRAITVKSDTFLRQFGVLRHMFNTARKKWQVPIQENLLASVSLPQPNKGRARRLVSGEEERICLSLKASLNPHLSPIITFALETAMRKGEIIKIRRTHLNIDRRTLIIPETKNGKPRTIPLSQLALDVLISMTPNEKGFVFPVSSSAISQAWRRMVVRANVEDFRFHDLRHEAISRFLKKG